MIQTGFDVCFTGEFEPINGRAVEDTGQVSNQNLAQLDWYPDYSKLIASA